MQVDASTGKILSHQPSREKAKPAKDFDSLLAGIDDAKARADEIFQQEVRAIRDRDRLMEEKFREAMERVDEVDDGKPPERPWDFD